MSLHLAANDALPIPASDALLQALPFAVYTTDAQGRITAFNQAAATLWGRAPRLGELWCGSYKLFHLDGTPMAHDDCPMAQTLKTGVSVNGVEAILERPDGSRLFFTPYPTAFKDAEGRITGGLNVLVDITERIRAERINRHFTALVESSDDAIIAKNLDGVIQSWNKGAERIFGYGAEEALGQHVSMLIPADRQNEEPGIIARIRLGERIDHYETVRRRKDGSLIDISLTVSPLKDAAGQVIGASKIARDITERRRAEQSRELLLHEIKHRVKNTLGTVQAIAAQTFREGPKTERDAFTGRLRTLSNAHDLLTNQEWDRVSVQAMIEQALAPFQDETDPRFDISGTPAVLNANQALLLAMTIHELATNAVKYGALFNDKGRVCVQWRLKDAGKSLEMTWRESGGPPVTPPTRKGFGSTLIERALQQERGRSRFDFRPEGVVCTLEIKV